MNPLNRVILFWDDSEGTLVRRDGFFGSDDKIALSNPRMRIGHTSRFGASHGYRCLTAASAETANPKTSY